MLLPRLRGHAGLSGIAWLYFAVIGMGYMLIEVVWIQQYSLLLGHSAHTFPIVLLALLLSSGAGSFYSQRGGPWLPFVFVAADYYRAEPGIDVDSVRIAFSRSG